MTQQLPDREAIARKLYEMFGERETPFENLAMFIQEHWEEKADAILSSFPVGVGQTRIAEGGQCNEQSVPKPSQESKGV